MTTITLTAPATPTAAPGWLDRAAYPFRARTLALPAGRMHYLDEGRGEPISFVHGSPS